MSGSKALLEITLEALYGGEAARLGVRVDEYAELVESYQEGNSREAPAMPRDATSTILAMRKDYRAPGTPGVKFIDYVAWKTPLEPWVDEVKFSIVSAPDHPMVSRGVLYPPRAS